MIFPIFIPPMMFGGGGGGDIGDVMPSGRGQRALVVIVFAIVLMAVANVSMRAGIDATCHCYRITDSLHCDESWAAIGSCIDRGCHGFNYVYVVLGMWGGLIFAVAVAFVATMPVLLLCFAFDWALNRHGARA